MRSWLLTSLLRRRSTDDYVTGKLNSVPELLLRPVSSTKGLLMKAAASGNKANERYRDVSTTEVLLPFGGILTRQWMMGYLLRTCIVLRR